MIQYREKETDGRVRQMESADLEQVCRIEQENFTDSWTINGFRDALSGGQTCFLVYEEAGRVKGYCGAYVVCDEADIAKVSVDRVFQKQGVATELLLSLFQILQSEKIIAFTLEVRKSNKAAISLYEKLGFVREGIRPAGYARPKEDAVIMWKR